jgi:hypothetical protein
MELGTKAQISKATLSLLVVVVFLFLLGVIVLILCAGLQINPFKEATTTFLISVFIGLIGVATILVLLNVATNVSLIADAKIAELRVEPKQGLTKKWLLAFFVPAFILVGLVFVGSFLSKEKYLGIVHGQAEEVVAKNQDVLAEVSRLLASGKVQDYKRIYEIRDFLATQRSGLPELTLIYSGKFADKLAFYKVGDYFPGDVEKGTYTPVYFACTKNLDCDYLTKFFSGENVGTLEKYTVRDDEFYIYVPVTEKEARFVLLFERRNSYGKVGS